MDFHQDKDKNRNRSDKPSTEIESIRVEVNIDTLAVLMGKTNLNTSAQLVKEMLSFYEWALANCSKGMSVISFNPVKRVASQKVSAPGLEYALAHENYKPPADIEQVNDVTESEDSFTTAFEISCCKDFVNQLLKASGLLTFDDIFKEAFGLYSWATDELLAGMRIISLNPHNQEIVDVVSSPGFNYAYQLGQEE